VLKGVSDSCCCAPLPKATRIVSATLPRCLPGRERHLSPRRRTAPATGSAAGHRRPRPGACPERLCRRL